jgi:cytochrome c-type biogenesis protein CcmF
VYLSLQRQPSEDDPTVGLRVIVQPLIAWLWIGGALMVVGTAMAEFPGRRRRPTDPVSALLTDAAAPPSPPEVDSPVADEDEHEPEAVPT